MSSNTPYTRGPEPLDVAPGDDLEPGSRSHAGVRAYLVGLALSIILTAGSFWCAQTEVIYPAAIPMAIAVLAIAQMGIHLIFFLHITTAPDNTNNALALAFGVLIAFLIVFGSIWIMNHLNHNVMPMQELMRMQR